MKTTKKTMIAEMLNKVNAKKNEEGNFSITAEALDELRTLVEESEMFKVCKNKKDETLFSIYDKACKTKFVVLKLVKKTKKTTNKTTNGFGTTKGKFKFYSIVIKSFGNDEVEEITSLNTCEQVKAFLKQLNKKNVEFLRIYSEGKEVRKSAWIERIPA